MGDVFDFFFKKSDYIVYLQAHKVLDMSLTTSMMRLPPFPLHSLKILSGVCCLAALSLSVQFIGFMSVNIGIRRWSELLAPFCNFRS